MKKFFFTFFFTILCFICYSQIWRYLGKTKQEIINEVSNNNNLLRFQYEGLQYAYDGTPYISFKSKNSESLVFYFSVFQICNHELIMMRVKDWLTLLEEMNQKYLKIERLKWTDENSGIYFEVDDRMREIDLVSVNIYLSKPKD